MLYRKPTPGGWMLALMLALPVLWAPSAHAADLEFTCDDPVRLLPVDTYVDIDAVLTNTGSLGDRYDLLRTIVYKPDLWSVPMCVGICHAPHIDSLQVLLPAGEDTTVGLRFNADFDEGGAIVQLTARSFLDPSKQKTITMAVVTTGTEVLIVDDDGGANYQDYLSAAYDGSRTWGVWPREVEAPAPADLSVFDAVAWMTGEATPTLTAEDTLAIGGCLDSGGRLFLTGQDIGYALCDPASPEYSAGMKAFYENRFGATYVADDTDSLTVEGQAGDPITDGLLLALSGGDGAGNQTSPSEIAPNGTGSASIFTYGGTSQTAGVRFEASGSRVVYLAFGFEAVSTSADRQTLAASICDWLVSVGAVDENLTPGPAPALCCYPNPFNPSVTIALSLPAPAEVEVEIFDMTGRRVRSLPVEGRPSGECWVEWDGRDAEGRSVASGLYACRVRADDTVMTEKLVLLK